MHKTRWLLHDHIRCFAFSLKELNQLKDKWSQSYQKMVIQFSSNIISLMKWKEPWSKLRQHIC